MKQTLKRYTKNENAFTENPQGYCIGFEWEDEKGVLRRTIYYKSTDDLEKCTTNAECAYQIFDDLGNAWATIGGVTSTADRHSYLDSTTGIYEPQPYVMQEIDREGVVTLEATNELKPNMVSQFDFLYALQLQLFEALIKNIQVLKFGATSFE